MPVNLVCYSKHCIDKRNMFYQDTPLCLQLQCLNGRSFLSKQGLHKIYFYQYNISHNIHNLLACWGLSSFLCSRFPTYYPDLNNMWCSIFKLKAKRGIVWESSLFCQSSTQMFKCKNLTCNEHFKYTMQWARHKKKCNKLPPNMKYTHKNDFLSTQILK